MSAIDEYNVFGVEVKSLVQPKMSDIKDIGKQMSFEDKQFTQKIQNLYTGMFNDPRFKKFLFDNGMSSIIQWSHDVDTACTDGFDGSLIANPDFMRKVMDKAGEDGVRFIVLHETMHNYYNNVKHAMKITTVASNVMIDRQINNEIYARWPMFKGIGEKIGVVL